MIVYTFQHPKILGLNTKELSCSPEYWDEEMVTYYNWMYEQYKKRIGSKTKSLIWVWEDIPEWYFEYNEEAADYWETEQSKKHRFRVLLTLDIPEEHILYSDYDAWHCPLNDGAVLSEIEYEEGEQGKVFDKTYGWKRIFDFEWLKVNGWGDVVIKQGVVDRIDIVAIKEVRYYDAKYKKIIDEKELIKFSE